MGLSAGTWEMAQVKDRASYITVGFVGSMSSLFIDKGVPLLRGQNILPYSLDLTNLKYISQETHRKWKKSALQPGDVVIVRVGYPGTACVIPKGLGDLNAASLVIVRPNPERLDSHFLCYVLNSPWGKAHIKGRLVGAAQQVFNTNTAADFEIPAPPLPVQRRIAAVLSNYDDLVENNTRRIRILEEMAQAIYREWFVHFRFPGHKKVKLIPSHLGPIPQGWSVARLAQVADINALSIKRGEEPEEIAYVDIASVSPGSIDEAKRLKFEDAPGRARRIVHNGDILWSMVRPNRKSYALVLDPEPNLIVSTGFAVVSAKKVPFSYLYHALTTDEFVGYLANRATGAAYPAVKAEDFENAQILRPDETPLDLFDSSVLPMLEMRNGLAKKNHNLRQTRDLLLPKLISGEMDVSDLDINVGDVAA
jgi:type I restriction enzyme S subunit